MVLFVSGAAIAFWTRPKALQFLQSVSGGSFLAAYTGNNYMTLILYMMLAFGGGFEFPIVLVFLQLFGMLDSAKLRQFRRYAIVLVFVVDAVITRAPTRSACSPSPSRCASSMSLHPVWSGP